MCLQASSDLCFSIIVELSISAIDCSFRFHFHPKFSNLLLGRKVTGLTL